MGLRMLGYRRIREALHSQKQDSQYESTFWCQVEMR